MTGVESQTPVPQETDPSASIMAEVGVTTGQMMKGVEVGVHGVSMLTMPVPVEMQPRALVQVMVYSQ
jgi:hypothetical protein